MLLHEHTNRNVGLLQTQAICEYLGVDVTTANLLPQSDLFLL